MTDDVPAPVFTGIFPPNATHPRIILIVVGTIALLSIIYVVTMAACILGGLNPSQTVLQGFGHAGDVLLGALIGLLINTRTPPPGDPLAPKAAPQPAADLPGQPVIDASGTLYHSSKAAPQTAQPAETQQS